MAVSPGSYARCLSTVCHMKFSGSVTLVSHMVIGIVVQQSDAISGLTQTLSFLWSWYTALKTFDSNVWHLLCCCVVLSPEAEVPLCWRKLSTLVCWQRHVVWISEVWVKWGVSLVVLSVWNGDSMISVHIWSQKMKRESSMHCGISHQRDILR